MNSGDQHGRRTSHTLWEIDPYTLGVGGAILALLTPIPYLMYSPAVAFGQGGAAMFLLVMAPIYATLEHHFGDYFE